MKVLFTMTPAFNPNDGGVQRTTFKLGKKFTELGYEVFYFSTSNQGHIPPKDGILYHGSETGGVNNSTNIQELVTLLKELKPDFVINQMPYEEQLREALYNNKSSVGYVLLGCLRNSLFNFKSNIEDRLKQMLPRYIHPFANNFIVYSFVEWRHKIKHSSDLRKILDAHDKFILLAPPNRKELDYFVGDYKSEKVISIPNSIPDIHRDEINKQKIILHVGRMNIAQKRSDLLLDFWEKCHLRLPDWRFIIVGDGPYMPTLKKDLAERKLPRVSLEGFQKPEPYYLNAAIFMMPSAFEGFPNTILEAQSFGCVAAAFNSYYALEWIVNDNKDTLLVEPFDTQAMVDKVVEVARDEAKLARMRSASLENVERFTINKVGEIWKELFEDLKKEDK